MTAVFRLTTVLGPATLLDVGGVLLALAVTVTTSVVWVAIGAATGRLVTMLICVTIMVDGEATELWSCLEF